MVPSISSSHKNLRLLVLLFKHYVSRIVFAPPIFLPGVFLPIETSASEDPLPGELFLDGLATYQEILPV